MMKRIVIAAVLLTALPWAAGAQVEKQVEVTKAYVPSLESAAKLPVAPDMTDTAKMRPEIDYTIMPLSLQTTLATRPIRPARVTYWEFNRPLPFYLKAGAGYPFNSVLDFYASTQNPGTGYAVGYINHEGRYADIRNDFGLKNNSVRMNNRIGAAAGKYFGKRTLEGELSYENRLYHRYGDYVAEDTGTSVYKSNYMPGARINFGDMAAAFRFGDDFQDLSRTNFEVAVSGGLFMSNPEIYKTEYASSELVQGKIDAKGRQFSLETHLKVARAFRKHRLAAEVGYEMLDGAKTFDEYKQQQIHAALRYGYEGGVVRFEAGADFYHDRIDTPKPLTEDGEKVPGKTETGNYLIPFARLDFNLGAAGLKPFLEIDGGVYDNSHHSLSLQNPYVAYNLWGGKSSVDYNGRFGIGGSLWRDRFTYRLYAAFSIRDNHLYWYGMSAFDGNIVTGASFGEFARQTVTSFNGEAEWRPVSPLLVSLGVHGYLYNDDTKLHNGAPAFDGRVGIRYEGRKFWAGITGLMRSERSWSVLTLADANFERGTYTVPFGVDLRADLGWKVSGRVSVFAEGRNLIDRRLYEFPWCPEYGVNFTVGVKANF